MTNDKIKSTVSAIKDGLTSDAHIKDSIARAVEVAYKSLENDTNYCAKLVFERIDQNINFVLENIKTNLWNTLDWNLSYHDNFSGQLVTPDKNNLTERDIEAINVRLDKVKEYLQAIFIAEIFSKFFSENGDDLISVFVKYSSFSDHLIGKTMTKQEELLKQDYETQPIQLAALKNAMVNNVMGALQDVVSYHEAKAANAAMEVFNKEMGR